MSDQKLLRGTMLLTAATMISKILGLIYIFPFTAIVGSTGIALYNYGYLPYMVLLSLATLGVPLAISKFVSKYHTLGDFRTGHRLFKSGMIVLTITGFIAFLILFTLAPSLAPLIVDSSELNGNTHEDIIFTIRMVSVALVIVPIMAVIRGYFQGFQSMGPTAVSQVIEQIVRIFFILVVTFFIIQVMNGELGTAVGFATFGAFMGAVGGLIVLIIYWIKRRRYIHDQINNSTVDHKLSYKEMYKELIAYALPLSFVGLALPLYQLIDLFTFNNTLIASGMDQVEAETYFGIFSGTAHKIILIPMALATALSVTLIPTITKSYTNGDKQTLQMQITQTFQIILFLTIPAAVGLSVLSYSVFGALYGLEDIEIGGYILRYYAPITLFFSLFAVAAAILQGLNKQKVAVIALAAGLVMKLLTTQLLLSTFGPLGGVLATYLGYFTSLIITIWAIGKYGDFHYLFIVKRALLIFIFALLMAIGVSIINVGMRVMFEEASRFMEWIILLLGTGAGGVIFLYFAYRSHLAGQVLGNRFRFLKREKEINAEE
ncbi:polysaccharide biosynthesis protein [Bacillus sp. JCM 19034]|uniref:putative polysaccharide biosynthesis protein n=1 Tax=Bacillus sp. JCM 19034 TaxID=1481928 RepID=UPI0007824622|nr:polysaccharide biosynthesis protein [Bacillus sp. JCM 19034]